MFFNSKKKLELQDKYQNVNRQLAEANTVLDAITESVCFIKFTPTGDVTYINEKFATTMGFRPSEVIGQHHSALCDPKYVQSDEYQAFWQDLRLGQVKNGVVPRRNKAGNPVWLQASYFPLRNASGEITGVAKVATDVHTIQTQQCGRCRLCLQSSWLLGFVHQVSQCSEPSWTSRGHTIQGNSPTAPLELQSLSWLFCSAFSAP